MDINELYDPNACSILGWWSTQRTRYQYFENKTKLEKDWVKILLVDMVNHPLENSVPATNELFFDQKHPDWTYFCLYCHSGGASWYIQKQLQEKMPQYNFINLSWGIGGYELSQI